MTQARTKSQSNWGRRFGYDVSVVAAVSRRMERPGRGVGDGACAAG